MKQIPAILALIVGLAAIGLHYYDSSEYAYVDSNRLLEEYEGMKDARKTYEKQTIQWQANIDTLMSEIKNKIMDYEKGVSKMTTKEKQLSKELIKNKQTQLQQYQSAIRDKAAQEDQRMTQEVLDQVNAYLQEYGKGKTYKIIFGTSNGTIVYAQEGIDLTDEVLVGLNNQYKGVLN